MFFNLYKGNKIEGNLFWQNQKGKGVLHLLRWDYDLIKNQSRYLRDWRIPVSHSGMLSYRLNQQLSTKSKSTV